MSTKDDDFIFVARYYSTVGWSSNSQQFRNVGLPQHSLFPFALLDISKLMALCCDHTYSLLYISIAKMSDGSFGRPELKHTNSQIIATTDPIMHRVIKQETTQMSQSGRGTCQNNQYDLLLYKYAMPVSNEMRL